MTDALEGLDLRGIADLSLMLDEASDPTDEPGTPRRKITGPILKGMREELGRRRECVVGGRRNGGVTQSMLAEVARNAGIRNGLSAKQVSDRERSENPICPKCARALAQAFRIIEVDIRTRQKGTRKPADLEPTENLLYSYSKLGTMDALADDEGYPRVDEATFDAVVFQPDEERLEQILLHSVIAERHGIDSSDTERTRSDVLASKCRLAVVMSIHLRNLRWTAPHESRRPLSFNHFGHDNSLWLLAHGNFGTSDETGLTPASRAIPCQDARRVTFTRGVYGAESPELLCKEVNAPFLSAGSISYDVNPDGAKDLWIRLIVLDAFDGRRNMATCAGFPMTVLAERASIAVAFEADVTPTRGLAFQAYPDTRVNRGPEVASPTHTPWKTPLDDHRLRGSDGMTGRRLTIARPHLGEVYGFSWPADSIGSKPRSPRASRR